MFVPVLIGWFLGVERLSAFVIGYP